jgi:hypothetical protein
MGEMTEVWVDIQGFEGYYQVSNLGNVRSLDRIQTDKNGLAKHYRGKTLKFKPNSRGYLRVDLKAPGKKRVCFVHRLVAMHFVENPDPKRFNVVNHLDNNFLNNDSDNLEWTNSVGNMQHALKQGRLNRTETWLGNLHKAAEAWSDPAAGYHPVSGERVVLFRSLQEAGRNGYEPSCICNCCKGKRKTHKGLKWKYFGR